MLVAEIKIFYNDELSVEVMRTLLNNGFTTKVKKIEDDGAIYEVYKKDK